MSGSFIDREAALALPVPSSGYVLPAHEGVPGRESDVKASAVSTGGSVALYRTVLDGYGPPLHEHRHEDETLYVIDGVVQAECGSDTFVGEAGATIFLPRELAHTFRSIDGPATFLFIVTPGHLDEFFRQRDGARGPGEVAHLVSSFF